MWSIFDQALQAPSLTIILISQYYIISNEPIRPRCLDVLHLMKQFADFWPGHKIWIVVHSSLVNSYAHTHTGYFTGTLSKWYAALCDFASNCQLIYLFLLFDRKGSGLWPRLKSKQSHVQDLHCVGPLLLELQEAEMIGSLPPAVRLGSHIAAAPRQQCDLFVCTWSNRGNRRMFLCMQNIFPKIWQACQTELLS